MARTLTSVRTHDRHKPSNPQELQNPELEKPERSVGTESTRLPSARPPPSGTTTIFGDVPSRRPCAAPTYTQGKPLTLSPARHRRRHTARTEPRHPSRCMPLSRISSNKYHRYCIDIERSRTAPVRPVLREGSWPATQPAAA
ncbi:hypothetical protein A0H81_06159 [Grifola frondosa]|uniref:Uncharacterized protein n=1 Tax=Grifola frondosa TaxID=5627 RepID=A0A1C7MB13_GRIFR|nr:hypothetical protein A0H81_06159 [Grifola frondosa]